MASNDILEQIDALDEQISLLPKGYISKKTVGGKVYFYHQWSENGVKQSRYLKDDEIKPLSDRIETRKRLQEELRALKTKLAAPAESRKKGTVLSCALMHKNVPVAALDLDRETGVIQKTGEVFAPEHLPVGVNVEKGKPDRAALNAWWTERAIPADRPEVRETLDSLEIRDVRLLLPYNLGLSLSDQYWICPTGSGLTWDRVNFFRNPFSGDFGDMLFHKNPAAEEPDLCSPDLTTGGRQKKRWKIINGKRCLVKGGSNPYRQQPFNETIAAEVAQRLGIPCVSCTVVWENDAPYSVCEDFVDENTELIPARRIVMTKEKEDGVSLYSHFVQCAESLGIPGVTAFLDRMIVLDYIIANEDRHMNSFGALRNAETLEWIGMAPVYGSGSSLCYDKSVPLMMDGYETACKPFMRRHADQLQLVTSFDWIDFRALDDLRDRISDVLSEGNGQDYLDERRIRAIAALTEKRIHRLEALAGKETADGEEPAPEPGAEWIPQEPPQENGFASDPIPEQYREPVTYAPEETAEPQETAQEAETVEAEAPTEATEPDGPAYAPASEYPDFLFEDAPQNRENLPGRRRKRSRYSRLHRQRGNRAGTVCAIRARRFRARKRSRTVGQNRQ